MPILFVLVGIIVILVLFNFISFESIKSKMFFLSLLIFFELGYFFGNITFFDVTINLLHILLVFIVYFYLLKYFRSYYIFVCVIVSCIYYLLLFRPIGIYLYSNLMVFSCFGIVPVFCFRNADRSALLIHNLLALTIVRVYYEVQTFTMSEVNFNFIFSSILVFVLIKIIRFLSKILLNSKRSNYAKKMFIICSPNFNLFDKYSL